MEVFANPTAEECAVLLGRELTENEQKHFNLLLEVATARLNALIGQDITKITKAHQFTLAKLLLARLLAVLGEEQKVMLEYGIVAKSVEDFKVEYDRNAPTPMTAFVRQNEDLLKTFAICRGEMRAGRTDDYVNYCI